MSGSPRGPLRRRLSSSGDVSGGYESTVDDEAEEQETHFLEINERPVDDISMEIFYKPHTITLLCICLFGLTYTAFTRDGSLSYHSNLFTGILGVFIFFMVISALTFPNGPFVRPHPMFWRMTFGLSVMYLMLLQFLIHQDYATVKALIEWYDPKMANYSIDAEKEYGVDCWDITWERLYSHLDWFAFGHFWGWGMKALIIRHYGICWSISIMWELTEMVFGHLLPNFYECWWDNLILDVLICNGLGIFTGMQVCRFLEMREYQWESFKKISSTTGKIKRVLLQFTPESWSPVRWMDPYCSWMRFVAIFQMMMLWQVVELNTFFVKHVFPMPPEHPICIARMLLSGLWAAPSARQYYSFITDSQCKRLGTQAWVFICIACSELILNIKFGLDLFSQTQMSKMIIWICLNIITSSLGLYVSMMIYKWRCRAKKSSTNEPIKDSTSGSTKSSSPESISRELRKRKVQFGDSEEYVE